MPWAGQAAVRQLAAGQRAQHVNAAVGQYVDRAVGPDGHDRGLAEHLAHRFALRQVGCGHEVLPAGLDQVRNLLLMVGPVGQPEGDMTAEQPAHRDGGQSGKAQRTTQPRVAGRQRSPVQAQRDDIAGGVDYADSHLLLMLLGPVGRTRQRGRRRRDQAGGYQSPGGFLITAGKVQDARR